MSLVLTVVRQPQGVELAQSSMTFDVAGGTIGRNAENNWQLPDPDRFVSSRHASIRYEGSQYYLVDTSTNGVYHNNTDEALGTGNQVALSPGDRLYFGEYELTVDIGQAPAADNMSLNDFDQWLDPEPASDFNIVDASAGGDMLSESEELDPLAALDRATSGTGAGSGSASGAIPDEDWLGASQPDNALPIEQAFTPPPPRADRDIPAPPPAPVPPAAAPQPQSAAQAIPDDWDIDDLLGGDDLDDISEPLIPPPAPAPSQVPTQIPSPPPPPAAVAPSVAPPPPPPASTEPPAASAAAEPDQGEILDEIESLLSADIDLPGAQQDEQDVAQQETDELDAFLGLDDSSPPEPVVAPAPITEPSAPVPTPTPTSSPAPAIPTPSATPRPTPGASAPQEGVSATTAPSAAASTDELIVALGLDPAQVSDEQKANFNQLIADITVESTRGLMAVLGARNAIKNEFRMNVTLIQAAENNPLKFSPNVDEALKNMFTAQSNAYLPGVLAVRNGFQDIADHQIAVIAGMREAFNAMMKQFDPSNLSMRFDKQQTRGGLMKGKSAKYWESYAEFYKDLANNMEDAFQDLFGEDFAEAYEQQMNTLASARKQDR